MRGHITTQTAQEIAMDRVTQAIKEMRHHETLRDVYAHLDKGQSSILCDISVKALLYVARTVCNKEGIDIDKVLEFLRCCTIKRHGEGKELVKYAKAVCLEATRKTAEFEHIAAELYGLEKLPDPTSLATACLNVVAATALSTWGDEATNVTEKLEYEEALYQANQEIAELKKRIAHQDDAISGFTTMVEDFLNRPSKRSRTDLE